MQNIIIKKKDALKYYNDSPRQLAKVLDLSVQAVSQWPDIVPERSAWSLNHLTGGKIKHKINI